MPTLGCGHIILKKFLKAAKSIFYTAIDEISLFVSVHTIR